MDETSSRAPDERHSPEPLVVAVKRTGGFAGLTRTWTAEARGDAASELVELVHRCPWDEPVDSEPRGADRFQWNIRARCGADENRAAELPDHAVKGPWRDLVDAVREWSEGEQSERRPAQQR